MVGNQRHADARRDLEALAVQGHGFGQQLAQGVGKAAHLFGDLAARALQATEQHHEFITAQAGDGVFRAHAGFQPCGDDFQHRIAHGMTEGVVDVLEVVEVEKQ
ncbi:hypothetical protein D3C84_349430 [compost metagenome]